MVGHQSPFLIVAVEDNNKEVLKTNSGDEIFNLSEEEVTGMFREIADELTRELNVTLSMFARADGVWGGLDRTHGNYTGIIGTLYKGEADISVTSLTVTAERAGDWANNF